MSASDTGPEIVLDVTNTGFVTGSDVVQLYLSTPLSTGTNGESLRQLKSFQKLNDMSPNKIETVTFSLTSRDLSVWDEEIEDWRVVSGTYTAYVGSSSCDLRQSATFVV